MSSTLERKRGTIFTIWLILVALANAWGAYRYYVIIEDYVSHSDPRFTGTLQWGLPLLLILSLVNIAGVALLFAWKKLGLYIILATNAIALVVSLMLGVPLSTLALGLAGLAILFYFYQQRSYMFQ